MGADFPCLRLLFVSAHHVIINHFGLSRYSSCCGTYSVFVVEENAGYRGNDLKWLILSQMTAQYSFSYDLFKETFL
jgi:hypothetical protein